MYSIGVHGSGRLEDATAEGIWSVATEVCLLKLAIVICDGAGWIILPFFSSHQSMVVSSHF